MNDTHYIADLLERATGYLKAGWIPGINFAKQPDGTVLVCAQGAVMKAAQMMDLTCAGLLRQVGLGVVARGLDLETWQDVVNWNDEKGREQAQVVAAFEAAAAMARRRGDRWCAGLEEGYRPLCKCERCCRQEVTTNVESRLRRIRELLVPVMASPAPAPDEPVIGAATIASLAAMLAKWNAELAAQALAPVKGPVAIKELEPA